MATTSQADGPSDKRGKLNENLDPKKPLMFKEYTKHSDTKYSIDFEREVPGHGPLKFRLFQNMEGQDDEKRVDVVVQCLDWDWRQIDDARIRVFVRMEGDGRWYTANLFVDPDDGDMCGLPYLAESYLTEDGSIDEVFCSIEESANDVGWNRFREIQSKPATFGDRSGRFVLQSEKGDKYYAHYLFLADCSPWLKTCLDANHDQIADGVPFKLECSTDTLWALLEWIYLSKMYGEHVCGMIKVANSLQMFGVVHDFTKFMREELNKQWFERLIEWFDCAAQYKLDGGKLEGDILKQLAVLSGHDQKKKDLLKQELEEYVKKNPKIVAAMAFESLFK